MNTPAPTAPATPLDVAVSLITTKTADARSQATHGDPQDRDYWNAKADALDWALDVIRTSRITSLSDARRGDGWDASSIND